MPGDRQAALVRRLKGAEARTTLAVAAVSAAWLWLRFLPAPLHRDTVRDLLLARDLTDGRLLHLSGAWTSFGQLHQGVLWLDVLGMARELGLGPPAVHYLALVSIVAAALVVLLVARRHLHLSRPLAAAAAVAFALLVRFATELPILWNPTLLPLPLALLLLLTVASVERTRLLDAAFAGVLLAACIDLHVVAFGLAGLLAFVFAAMAPRPWRTVAVAGAACFGAMLLDSPVATIADVLFFLTKEPVLVGLAGIVPIAGWALRGRMRALSALGRSRAVILVWFGLFAAILVLSILPGPGHRNILYQPRYLIPFLPGGILGLALGLDLAIGRLAPAGLRSLAGWAVAGLLLALTMRPASVASAQAVKRGVRLADLPRIEATVRHHGLHAQDLLRHLYAVRRGMLVGALATVDPAPWTPPAPNGPDLLVLRVPPGHEVPRLPGAETSPLTDGAHLVVWPFRAWQDPSKIRLCIDPDGPGPGAATCRAFGWTYLNPRAGDGLSPWAYFGLPELGTFVHGRVSNAAVMRYERPIRPVGPDAARVILVLPGPENGCWRVDGVDGLPSKRLAPGLIRIERAGSATGLIRMSRRNDARGCPQSTDELALDPAVLELPTDADLTGWQSVLAEEVRR